MRSQFNYLQYGSDTTSDKGGQSVGAKVEWRLQEFSSPGDEMCNTSHTSRRWAHLETKYRNCIGLAGWPSCTTNLIHNFTIVPCCGNGKVYVFLGNYP